MKTKVNVKETKQRLTGTRIDARRALLFSGANVS
jgi:hypothetical protein